MPTKKKSSSPRRGRARVKADRLHRAGNRIRETWETVVEALSSAEAGAERQLRVLLARKGIKPADARAALASFRKRAEKERRKAAREIDARLTTLQERLSHERKNLARRVEEAVRGTLVALNIPSRHEVSELTRKVAELSHKIDGFRRSSPRAGRRSAAPARAASH